MINKVLKPIFNILPENNRIERIWKMAQVDFKKRYFNSKLGLLWAFINPLFRLFVYYNVFSYLGRMTYEHFGLYIFSGLLLWMSFAESSNNGMKILHQKKYLLESIQFNKIDLFISGTLSVFMGLVFNIFAYIVISLIVGIPIFFEIIYLPILIINLFVLCLGAMMILAVINIFLKDITHLWTMLILLGFWSAPIIFPIENFQGKLEFILYLHPVSGIIINFRHALMNGDPIELNFLIYNWIYAITVFMIGRHLINKYWQHSLERA